MFLVLVLLWNLFRLAQQAFLFTLSSNSQIQVTSADRLDINGVSGTSAEFKTAKTCTSAESVTLFLPVSTATNNIAVTPTTGTCTVPAASTNTSGSSSGRGGGGGATTLAVSVPASVAPTGCDRRFGLFPQS